MCAHNVTASSYCRIENARPTALPKRKESAYNLVYRGAAEYSGSPCITFSMACRIINRNVYTRFNHMERVTNFSSRFSRHFGGVRGGVPLDSVREFVSLAGKITSYFITLYASPTTSHLVRYIFIFQLRVGRYNKPSKSENVETFLRTHGSTRCQKSAVSCVFKALAFSTPTFLYRGCACR